MNNADHSPIWFFKTQLHIGLIEDFLLKKILWEFKHYIQIKKLLEYITFGIFKYIIEDVYEFLIKDKIKENLI